MSRWWSVGVGGIRGAIADDARDRPVTHALIDRVSGLRRVKGGLATSRRIVRRLQRFAHGGLGQPTSLRLRECRDKSDVKRAVFFDHRRRRYGLVVLVCDVAEGTLVPVGRLIQAITHPFDRKAVGVAIDIGALTQALRTRDSFKAGIRGRGVITKRR